VRVVHDQVSAIDPFDATEAAHRSEVLGWLERTDDIYRGAKPATPERHLVSYTCVMDPADGSSLLVDHINAGLHLPPGGHVEPEEDSVDTARREVLEELGLAAEFPDSPPFPSFVTVQMAGGVDGGHTDVSLWFVLVGRRDMELRPDPDEFHGVRWWAPAELRDAHPAAFDPNLFRFLSKVTPSDPRRV